VLAVTIAFSIYVIWLKRNATCLSCGIATIGLPVSQLTLAVFALVGSLIIAYSYYLSQKMQKFQFVCLGVTGIFAAVTSFLMTLQIHRSICWPCLTTDILFYLIFVLMCLDVIYQNKEKINLGGIKND
jgi:cellobiose-specific phosphotransferase system component IIC